MISIDLAPKDGNRADDSVLSTQDHITTYTEDIGIVDAGVNRSNFSVVPALDPYPPNDIAPTLTRSYPIKTFTWSPAQTQGARLEKIELPGDLFNVTFIADKIKYFSYFRSMAEISFRMNTTKFEYGTLMVSWLPFYKEVSGSAGWRMKNLGSASQCNPVLISAQQGSTVSIRMPWIHPEPWMQVDSPLPELGTMVVHVLHQLTSVSVDPPADITVSVFARFIEPNVAGYAPDVAPASTAARATLVPQSSATATAPGVSKPKREHTTKDVREVFAMRKPGPTMQQEAKAKSSSGIISSAIKGVASYAPMVAMVDPGLLPVALMGSFLADTIGPIFSAIGLNKPNDLSIAHSSRATYGPSMTHGEGIDYATKLSLDPECAISTDVGLCGYENPQPTISEIITRPSLISTFSFNSVSTPGTKIYDEPNMPLGFVAATDTNVHNIVPTYAAYYGNIHSYWRGGLKYKFNFCTSSFVTTRVRICFEVEPVTSAIDAVAGDLVSMVVDISGDTTVEVMIPYLAKTWYTRCIPPRSRFSNDPSYSAGHVTMYLVSPVVSVDSAANPPVYCSVWQSAAEDFRYFQLSNPMIPSFSLKYDNDLPPPVVVKKKYSPQTDITKDFSKPFKGLIEGVTLSAEAALVNGEDSSTLAQILHRYVVYGHEPLVFGNNIIRPQERVVDPHYASTVPFLFYRGGKRFFYADANEFSATQLGQDFNYDVYPREDEAELGGTTLAGDYKAHLHFETAWYEPFLFRETFPTMNPFTYQKVRVGIRDPTGEDPPPSIFFYSMADDYSLGCLAATPLWQYQVPDEVDLTVRKVHGWRYQKPIKR